MHQLQPATTPPPLSLRLREETREAHRAAERAPFLRRLLRGAVGRDDHAVYLAALYRVYSALEAAFERHRDHPVVAPLRWPALWRSDALARDLAVLLGPERWIDHVVKDTAAESHVTRIEVLSARAPALLVAHAYTRYLGDLAGGQVLRAAVARFAPDALAFHEFPLLPDLEQARRSFRARLDALPLGPRDEAAVIAEARVAFAETARLLAALGD